VRGRDFSKRRVRFIGLVFLKLTRKPIRLRVAQWIAQLPVKKERIARLGDRLIALACFRVHDAYLPQNIRFVLPISDLPRDGQSSIKRMKGPSQVARGRKGQTDMKKGHFFREGIAAPFGLFQTLLEKFQSPLGIAGRQYRQPQVIQHVAF